MILWWSEGLTLPCTAGAAASLSKGEGILLWILLITVIGLIFIFLHSYKLLIFVFYRLKFDFYFPVISKNILSCEVNLFSWFIWSVKIAFWIPGQAGNDINQQRQKENRLYEK
jgi:hypothetical protein